MNRMDDEDDNRFLQVLSSHLGGRKWGRVLKLLKFNLQCTDRGVKPSYLWDCGPTTDSQSVTKLICHLKRAKLLQSCLHVVCYADEIFVVNLEAVCRFLDEFQVKFVDIGQHSELKLVDRRVSERVISIVKDKIDSFLDQHTRNLLTSEEALSLELDCLFPPSVFGLLLGYPVCYWSSSRTDAANNLSFVPLSVYELTIEGHSTSVLKFSAPISLNLNDFVGGWLLWMQKSLSCKLNLSVEQVLLPCVQL